MSNNQPMPALFVVTTEGTTTRVQRVRRAERRGKLRDRAQFVAAVLAWVAWSAVASGFVGVSIGSVAFGVLCGVLVFRCFDFERHRGRRRMEGEITLRVEQDFADDRTVPRVHVRIDGDDLPPARDARFVLARFYFPRDSGGGNVQLPPISDLSLVLGGRVFVIAHEQEKPPNNARVEPAETKQPLDDAGDLLDPPETEASSQAECRPASVRELATALALATGLRIALDTRRFGDDAHPVGVLYPWPREGSAVLLIWWCVPMWLGCVGLVQASSKWAAGAYLAAFGLLTFPAQIQVQAARTAAKAQATLRSLYGNVQPFPGGTRWRPWPAFLLAIAVPVALGLGWVRFFPDAVPGAH